MRLVLSCALIVAACGAPTSVPATPAPTTATAAVPTGTAVPAASTPARSPLPTATPAPTPRPVLAIRFSPLTQVVGQAFEIVVEGLDPSERIEMSLGQPGSAATFFPFTADDRGEVRTRFGTASTAVVLVVTARRASGEVLTAASGAAAASTPAPQPAAAPPLTAAPPPAAVPPVAVPPPTAPPTPAPTSHVTPLSGPLGTTFLACVAGLPAGAGPVDVRVGTTQRVGAEDPTALTTSGGSVQADGSYCLRFTAGRQAEPTAPGFRHRVTHVFSATARGVTQQVSFDITTSHASGTSACEPASGTRGSRFLCTFYGLPPAAFPVEFTRAIGSGTPVPLSTGTAVYFTRTAVYADGSVGLAHGDDVPPGTYTLTATAAGVSVPVAFVVTP